MAESIVKCCGTCATFIRETAGLVNERGWCDNWAGVYIHESWCCHNPCLWKPKTEKAEVLNVQS